MVLALGLALRRRDPRRGYDLGGNAAARRIRASYEVNGSREQVSDETADLATIRAVSTRIQRPKAPVIDRMEVNMRNGVIDRNDKQLKKLAAVKAQARVLAADIATFLEAKPGLDNVQVDLHPPGEITVTAQPVIAGYTLPKVALIRMRGGSP